MLIPRDVSDPPLVLINMAILPQNCHPSGLTGIDTEIGSERRGWKWFVPNSEVARIRGLLIIEHAHVTVQSRRICKSELRHLYVAKNIFRFYVKRVFGVRTKSMLKRLFQHVISLRNVRGRLFI